MTSREKPYLVVFDLNGTLIRENSWHDLNLVLGVTPGEDAMLLEAHAEGRITYLEGQKRLEMLYKERGKATRAIIEQVLYSYTYLPHVRETVAYLSEKGYTPAIVSGSIDILVNRVAEELGIRLYDANNRLVFDAAGNFTALEVAGDDGTFKVDTVKRFAAKLGIGTESVFAVGDSENDRELFAFTRHGVTFAGSPVEDEAWKVIKDLSQLRKIL